MIVPTVSVRGAGGTAGLGRVSRAGWAAAAASVLAAGVALYLRLWMFDVGSPNNDEVLYLSQARALIHGHLVVPFTGDPGARQPWLFAIGHSGYISKYLPVVAAIYAIGLWVSGSVTPVLVCLAAAVPALTYRLGRELGLRPARAAAAAGLFALSPAMLIQSGLVLSYLPFIVLMLGCWTTAFRALGGSGRGLPAAAGLLAASATCVRPMDGLLLLGPTLVWVVARRADRRGTAAAIVGGAAPVLALLLAYNQHVAGGPFRLPFSLLEPMDKLGFGDRRLYPEDQLHQFGLSEAWQGTVRHFAVEPAQWMFGFLAVVPLALWAIRPRGEADARHRVLLASSGLTLLAYFCFWGPWDASVLWGGTRTLGPFYSLALLVPFVLAALAVEVRTGLLVGLLGLACIHPVVHAVDAFDDLRGDHEATTQIMALVDPTRPTLIDADPPYLGHPVARLWQPGTLLASRVPPAALPAGPLRLVVIDGYPYLGRPRYQLRAMQLTQGTEVGLRIRRTGFGPNEILVVSRGGHTSACRQGRVGVTLRLSAGGVTGCSGQQVPPLWARRAYRSCPDTSCLIISTFTRLGPGVWREGAWRRLPVDSVGGSVRLLTDGPALRSAGAGWISVRARRTPFGLHSQRSSAKHGLALPGRE